MANRSSFIHVCYAVLFALWLLSMPALPVVAVWRYVAGNRQFSIITLTVWVISSVAFYFYNKALNKVDKAMKLQENIKRQIQEVENQKSQQERLVRRKTEGICKLDDRYVLVDSKNWDPQWNHPRANWVDWLEDEVRQLQPDDKVYSYKFGHGMGLRIGCVIVRKDKVVANALEIMS